MQEILPYAVGNAHPAFMGWVHGGGTAVGMLAETLAAGLDANVGGRNQIPVAVEGQVTTWMHQLFGFPEDASGLFVTGTSMANLVGVLVARTREIARHLAARVKADSRLQLLAPVALNIVCFRHVGASESALAADGGPGSKYEAWPGNTDGRATGTSSVESPGSKLNALNALNADIVVALQESGVAAPSTTRINGVPAIRAAIVNHRSTIADVDALYEAVLAIGQRLAVTGSIRHSALHHKAPAISQPPAVLSSAASSPSTP